MSYPGDRTLDPIVQQRILTAFGEAVRLYREGHAEECRTILRSILEIDPAFVPAQRLSSAVISGSAVDLGEMLGQVTAASTVRPEELVETGRQAMAARDFTGAAVILQELLRELPGHSEGRTLLAEAQARSQSSKEVEGYLQRARQAVEVGMVDGAQSFLAAAEKLDPAHPDMPELRRRIQEIGATGAAQPEFEFDVFRAEPESALPPAGPIDDAVPRAHEPQPPAEVPVAAPPPSEATPDVTAPPAVEAHADQRRLAAFEPAAPEFVFSADEGESLASVGDVRVAALLDQGQESFDRADYAAAIDTWSRIYLVDAHHEDATRRIEEARRRREEVERLAEHRFYEARDAFEQGRSNEARRLCHEVLELQPQHLEAHDLLQRLETPSAPPPPPPMPPETSEEDLFKDDFVPARLSRSGALPAAVAAGEDRAPRPQRAAARKAVPLVGRLPVPVVAVIGGALVVLLVVGFLLRGVLFGGADSEVMAGLAEAEKLAGEGQYQQAVTLLQSLEVEGEPANQVRQRLLEYQRQLRSAKAPTTPDEATAARHALAEGSRVKALHLIRQGLAKVPGDKELLALATEITAVSPVLSALADAVGSRNYDAVRLHASTLLSALPEDAEAKRLWTAATFDLAVTLLRKYQVAAAHSLLQELVSRGSDPEAERLKDLANTYKSRPIDPRYQIFVTSVELRSLE